MYERKIPQRYTCNAQTSMKLLGKKWSLLILKKFSLENNSLSFSELKKDLKISQKVLDERLKEFESLGIISKHDTYSLTPLGKKLNSLIYKIEQLQQ